MYRPSKVVQIIKSITAREIFLKFPYLKKKLWGSEFWTKGYFISTVGKHGDENKLRNYVKNKGIKNYKQIHSGQLKLFDTSQLAARRMSFQQKTIVYSVI